MRFLCRDVAAVPSFAGCVWRRFDVFWFPDGCRRRARRFITRQDKALR
jgi:hypothetical protein